MLWCIAILWEKRDDTSSGFHTPYVSFSNPILLVYVTNIQEKSCSTKTNRTVQQHFDKKQTTQSEYPEKLLRFLVLKARKINEHILELILSCAWHMHAYICWLTIYFVYNVCEWVCVMTLVINWITFWNFSIYF